MNYQSEVYWTKLSSIISEKTYNVWKALDKGLLSYHDLLFERKKLVEETKSQMDKNKELKDLLRQYMQSDVSGLYNIRIIKRYWYLRTIQLRKMCLVML
jgi:hypothetical protein